MRLRITCKMCRREGVSICGREKCAVKRRPFAPGAHGPTGHSRPTAYGLQLREKQKARRIYGMMERQFRKYFDQASNLKGDTGELLMRMLETRLDNVVYRLGFAKTRAQARQLVSHGQFSVNGIATDIPSYAVRPGMKITVNENKRTSGYFKQLDEQKSARAVASWLRRDDTFTGTVLSLPAGDELKENFDPKLIVEFYSR